MTLRDKLLQAVQRHALFEPGQHLLVAVSGGQDSVALGWLLAELREEWRLRLTFAHLHHGLRGAAADADQAFVADFANQLGVPFVTERVAVEALARHHRGGLEQAGREARYAFLEHAATARGCDRVALGHTADDQAETVLLNLLRGAGLVGLAGMPARRGAIIRPLLLATRQDTADFCRACGLPYRTDESNADPRFRRNQLRAELLPWLEAHCGPGVAERLNRTAEHLQADLEWTAPLVTDALARARHGSGLSCQALRGLPAGLRYRLLRQWLAELGHPLTELTTERWEALDTLAQRDATGKRVELSGGWSVRQEYGVLLAEPSRDSWPKWPSEVLVAVPGEVVLPDGRRVVTRLSREAPAPEAGLVLDAERAGTPLRLRLPRPGDQFVPSGMQGHKKLHDYFVDNKVPRGQRRPLLVLGAEGAILGIVGHRLAETARPSHATRNFLIVGVHPEACE